MRIMKVIYICLGFIFCGIGAVGAVLPVLPTTPFLLLAAFFFAKGSERLNKWFISTKLYKNHLESFVKNRAMTLKTKITICSFASIMLLIALVAMNNIPGRIVILCIMAFKYYYFIFRIKTIKPEKVKNKKDEKDKEF